ncbi:class I SAM-dependent methyltransferase [Methanotorris igneus]|uniref:Methyltransferase type 11 n=1 Tax=Methanotorris igneus (strain DSM 5666 / JCM 11834 / Kol 5) TaxID=880724 RepID=F6BF81_METIK|nr:class I SAM-dependent methyltransferase [Methanotorris igneus]AEF96951.1 Methyltransferase type 11 [Methanotorris igneus Kol 5]
MNIKEYIKSRWNEHAKNYDKIPAHGVNSEKDKKVVKNALKEILKRKMKILDVGCGTGFLSLILAELGHEVVGIDLSEGMLNKAREKAKNLGLDIEFMVGDAENLPFEDNTFDAIVERHILWTLPNPKKAIKEWMRVLKDGGKIILIESESRGVNVAKHHYDDDKVIKNLPFSNGLDLERFKEIANECNLTFKVETLDCEKINLMIVCEKTC